MAAEELLDYEALAKLSGLSEAALRKWRSHGQLPEPDAPGPQWQRATVAELLAEGSRVPATTAPVSPKVEEREAPAPSPATPEPAAPRMAPPVAECPHPRAERVVRPWGAFCQACGRLVR